MTTLYIESPFTDPRANLALEEYVFERLPRDRHYFMLWQNYNAVIVGRHQNTAREVNGAYIRENGVAVVRRLSGGGAVYHDRGNINFTFIVDGGACAAPDLKKFCRRVAAALGAAGVQAEVSGRNDVTIDGQKCSGNAQYVRDGRVMHHGTILFDSDLSVVSAALRVGDEKYAGRGVPSVRSRVTNVRPHLPTDMSLEEFWALLRTHLAAEGEMEPYFLTDDDLRGVAALRAARYDRWDWNYGASPDAALRRAERFEGCGLVEVYLEVKGGRIAALSTYGDYFGNGQQEGLLARLLGCRPEEGELLAVLSGLDVAGCYAGLTAAELARLIAL